VGKTVLFLSKVCVNSSSEQRTRLEENFEANLAAPAFAVLEFGLWTHVIPDLQ